MVCLDLDLVVWYVFVVIGLSMHPFKRWLFGTYYNNILMFVCWMFVVCLFVVFTECWLMQGTFSIIIYERNLRVVIDYSWLNYSALQLIFTIYMKTYLDYSRTFLTCSLEFPGDRMARIDLAKIWPIFQDPNSSGCKSVLGGPRISFRTRGVTLE